MSVSFPSGLCSLTSLPQVTSQTQLESVVLEPQPGVTAGFAVCSRLWVVRTGILRSLLASLNRLGFLYWLRLLGSQAPHPLIASVSYWGAPLPLVTSQTRLGSDVREPQPGVTAGFAVCSRPWVFWTSIQRSLLSPISRLGSALGLH